MRRRDEQHAQNRSHDPSFDSRLRAQKPHRGEQQASAQHKAQKGRRRPGKDPVMNFLHAASTALPDCRAGCRTGCRAPRTPGGPRTVRVRGHAQPPEER